MNKTIWICICGAILIMLLYQISGILLPFVLAFILAYALAPMTKKMNRHLHRSMSAGIVVIGVMILAVSLVLVLVPILQSQVMDFMLKIPNMVNLVWEKLKDVLTYGRQNMTQQQLYQLSDAVSQTALNVFQGLGSALTHVISQGIAVFSLVSLLLITPVVLFYILRDWDEITTSMKEMIPMKKREQASGLLKEINTTLSGFIRGQASVCLILALYYATALSLVGLDMGALVGILTGLLIFVPYVGYGVGLILSVLIGLLQPLTNGQWIALVAVFIAGQVAEGYFLTPYLVGKRVGLHPVWIIFALLAGAVLAGFLGVLVAVPVAAILGVVVRHVFVWYRTTHFFKGE